MRFIHANVLPLWSSTDLSASRNGPWLKLNSADTVSLQVTMGSAGTLNGTWTLQAGLGRAGAVDDVPDGSPATLDGSTYTVVNGLISGEGTLIVNITRAPFSYVRWVWTRTSGTGTLTESLMSTKSE